MTVIKFKTEVHSDVKMIIKMNIPHKALYVI